jgi:hypothetical protein
VRSASSLSPGIWTPASATPPSRRSTSAAQKPSAAAAKERLATAPSSDEAANTQRPSIRSVRLASIGTAAA